MPNVTVCVRFRPLSFNERRDLGDKICIESLDSAEAFIIEDETKNIVCEFRDFDKVFYENSKQADVFEFVAPIVRDVFRGINGTIITYGQTGAGKTFTLEGTISDEDRIKILPRAISDEHKKRLAIKDKRGILPRAIEELFACIRSSNDPSKYTIKLSMVEIYMDEVRDLFDLARDCIEIRGSRKRGILLHGAKKVLLNPGEAKEAVSKIKIGISNRREAEKHLPIKRTRSHSVYIITVHQKRKCGKLILVDLAGSEEAKTKRTRATAEYKNVKNSLSALGTVLNALTRGSPHDANYDDPKLIQILQDVIGGGSCCLALLCCCSQSSLNASESLCTLHFGARAKNMIWVEDEVEEGSSVEESSTDESEKQGGLSGNYSSECRLDEEADNQNPERFDPMSDEDMNSELYVCESDDEDLTWEEDEEGRGTRRKKRHFSSLRKTKRKRTYYP